MENDEIFRLSDHKARTQGGSCILTSFHEADWRLQSRMRCDLCDLEIIQCPHAGLLDLRKGTCDTTQ
jgi:hypothetical protein